MRSRNRLIKLLTSIAAALFIWALAIALITFVFFVYEIYRSQNEKVESFDDEQHEEYKKRPAGIIVRNDTTELGETPAR